MKTSTLPSLRVDAALRQAAEDVLHDGESLSSFVEQSVRTNIAHRKTQAEFIAKGLASRAKARRTGTYVASGRVLQGLERRLSRAKAKLTPPA